MSTLFLIFFQNFVLLIFSRKICSFFTYSIICIAYKYKPIPLTVFLLCQTAVCFYRFFSSRKFFLFCNKTVGLCIVHMNGWKDSCFVKRNNAKPITNQTIYEILWCITLYHTRCVFFSGHGHLQKTLKKLPHTNLVCGSLLISVFFHIHLLFHSRDQHFLCRNCLVGK